MMNRTHVTSKVRRLRQPVGATGRSAAVLLEVILALAILTGGSVAVLCGLNASVRTAERLRTRAVAADLAVTLMSEIRMDLVGAVDDGPNEYEQPYEGWTWQIVTSELTDVIDQPQTKHVEIIVSNPQQGFTRRLSLLMPIPPEPETAIGYSASDSPADAREVR